MLKGVIKNENDSVDNSTSKANVINVKDQNNHNGFGHNSVIKNSAYNRASVVNDLNESGSADDDESSSSCKIAGRLDLLAKAAETIGRDEEMFNSKSDELSHQRAYFESLKEFLEKNPDHQKMQNFLKANASNVNSAKKPKINSMLSNNSNMNSLNAAFGLNSPNDDKNLSMHAAAAAAAAALVANSNGFRAGNSLDELKLSERQQQFNKLIQNSSNQTPSALLESFMGASGSQMGAGNSAAKSNNYDHSADGPASHPGNLVDLSLLQTLFNANANAANGTNSPVHPSLYNVALENHSNYLLNNSLASKSNPVNKSASSNLPGLGDSSPNIMANLANLNALAYAKSMSNNPLASLMNGNQNGLPHSNSTGGNGLTSPNASSPTANNYPMFIGKNGKPTRPFKAYPREPLALPLGCTPALLQLQNTAQPTSAMNLSSNINPKSNTQPSLGGGSVERNKSNSPQSTSSPNPAKQPAASAPNGVASLGANPLLSNPNILVALQALLGQQQQQSTNPMQSALSLENILGVIAALSAPANSNPPPASPGIQRHASPPAISTPTASSSHSPQMSSSNADMLLSGQSSASMGSIPLDASGDLIASCLPSCVGDLTSSLDISSLSAFTSTDFCTLYRKRIQQAQERLLQKQKSNVHQQSDDSDEKSSGKRRTSSAGRKRSNASNLNENSRESNSESSSPTRFLESERDALRANFMKQLSESQLNELKQRMIGSALLTGAESPESDPRHSPTSSPDTTGEYMNYPPKKRLRMQQQDEENKDKLSESLNESGDGSVTESAVTTSSPSNENQEKSQKSEPAGSSASSNVNKENVDNADENQSDKVETELSSIVTNADVENELIDSTSSAATAALHGRLFMNECVRLNSNGSSTRSSRYTPSNATGTPPSLSLSISSSSSTTSGIGSSSSSPPLSTSSSIYSSLTSSSSSCSSSISNDPNTLFNNNINIGNINSLVGQHVSRQRSLTNKTSVTSPNAVSTGSGNVEDKQTSKTTSSRNSSTDPDMDKDDAYKERRRKNNEAAKRSRDARRAKEDDIALRAAILERENLQLKVEVAQLKQETNKLRCMLYNS